MIDRFPAWARAEIGRLRGEADALEVALRRYLSGAPGLPERRARHVPSGATWGVARPAFERAGAGGLRFSEVGATLGVPSQSTSVYLKRWVRAGVLEKIDRGRYRLADGARGEGEAAPAEEEEGEG